MDRWIDTYVDITLLLQKTGLCRSFINVAWFFTNQKSSKKKKDSNTGVQVLTEDCNSLRKTENEPKIMARVSNAPSYLELNPSPPKPVDRMGARGEIWNCFSDRRPTEIKASL